MQTISRDFQDHYAPNLDTWGACMGALFDICNELEHRGDQDLIPDDFQYSSGVSGPYPRDEQTHDWDGHSSTDLVMFAEHYLWRLRDICKRRGWDY